MNDSLNEQISRHFDAANSADETSVLGAMLATDPAAAQSFARAARTEALLEKALGTPVKPKLIRQPWRWAGLAAVLVAAGLVGVKFFGADRGGHAVVVISEKSDQPANADLKSKSNIRLVRPASLSGGAPEAKAPVNLEWFLANYYVDVDLNGLTVDQALLKLKESIAKANLMHRPWLEEMTLRSRGEPSNVSPTISSFLPRSAALASLLKMCALHQTVELQTAGSIKLFEAPAYLPEPPTVAAERVETSVLLMPIDFNSRYKEDLDGAINNSGAYLGGLKHVLQKRFGLILSQNENATLLPGQNKAILKVSKNKLAFVEAALDILKERVTNVALTSKIIQCPVTALPPGFDASTGMILTDEDFQKFTRALSVSGASTSLFTSPSLVTKQNQRGRIEISREVPIDGRQDPDWIGLSIPMDPDFIGETISCSGACEFRLLAGAPMPDFHHDRDLSDQLSKLAQMSPTKELRSFSTEFETYIPNGYTAMFTLDVPTTDGIALFCLSAFKIDPSGTASNVEPEQKLLPSPEPLLKTSPETKQSRSLGGIKIDGDSMKFSQDNTHLVFSGDVHLSSKNLELSCGELTIVLSHDAIVPSETIERVLVTKGKATAISFSHREDGQEKFGGTCGELEYVPATNTLILKDLPRVTVGGLTYETLDTQAMVQIQNDASKYQIQTTGAFQFVSKRSTQAPAQANRAPELTIDAKRSVLSKENRATTFSGEVRFRSADLDIDCEELEVKRPGEGIAPQPKGDSSKPPQLELHARSQEVGSIKFVCRRAAGFSGVCQSLDFDPGTGVLTGKGFFTLEQNGTKLEGTDKRTVFRIAKDGKIDCEGPTRISKPVKKP